MDNKQANNGSFVKDKPDFCRLDKVKAEFYPARMYKSQKGKNLACIATWVLVIFLSETRPYYFFCGEVQYSSIWKTSDSQCHAPGVNTT